MKPTASVIRQRLHARARVRHWLALARVAELGNLHKAADAMGMTQPSLTQLLADLENLLGAPLFHRHARGMRPTAMGAELLPVAQRILAAVSDGAEQAAALQNRSQAVVRIGAIGGAINGLLARVLPACGRQHADLMLQLVEADPTQLLGLLARGDLDLALCRAPAVLPAGWAFQPLIEDHFVVVAAPHHPLVRQRRIEVDALRRHTWLALPIDSAARGAFDALFGHDAGTQPAIRQVSTRVPAMLWAMLKAEPLLALVPASVTRQLVEAAELVELDLAFRLPFEAIGVLAPDSGSGPGVARVLAFLQAACTAA